MNNATMKKMHKGLKWGLIGGIGGATIIGTICAIIFIPRVHKFTSVTSYLSTVDKYLSQHKQQCNLADGTVLNNNPSEMWKFLRENINPQFAKNSLHYAVWSVLENLALMDSLNFSINYTDYIYKNDLKYSVKITSLGSDEGYNLEMFEYMRGKMLTCNLGGSGTPNPNVTFDLDLKNETLENQGNVYHVDPMLEERQNVRRVIYDMTSEFLAVSYISPYDWTNLQMPVVVD